MSIWTLGYAGRDLDEIAALLGESGRLRDMTQLRAVRPSDTFVGRTDAGGLHEELEKRETMAAASAITRCERCGLPCRTGGARNPEARLLRRSATGQGYCPSCATTQFLKTTSGLSELMALRGPELLRDPIIQHRFVAVMAIGGADATPGEIDWERVIANWALPVAGEREG